MRVIPGRLIAVLVGICVLAGPALGQGGGGETIPFDLINAEDALSPDQQRLIDRYQESRIGHLLRGTPEQLAEARRQLSEPLNRGGASALFLKAYSSAMVGRLTEAAASDDLVVRLNAMILAAELYDPATLALVEQGMSDPNPAIRYWASKVAAQCVSNTSLTKEEHDALLERITGILSGEPSDHVKQGFLMALVGLESAEASSLLLNSLNQRVEAHVLTPRLSLAAALEGLRALFVRVVEDRSKGDEVPDDLVRHLTEVSYRYMVLSARLLANGGLGSDDEGAYVRMLDLASKILPWSVKQLSPDGRQPAALNGELNREDWAAVVLHVDEWGIILGSPGVGLAEDKLHVAFP